MTTATVEPRRVAGTAGRFSATIRKGANELVRIALDEYRGRQVVDIRVWIVQTDSGEVYPTKRGVTLAATRLPELVEALSRALATVSPTSRPAA